MYIQERGSDTCVVKFSYSHEGVKAEWSHSCKPVDKRSARKVAEDFANQVGRRLDLIRNGDVKIPPEALESRKALKAFIIGIEHQVPAKTNDGTIQKLVTDYLAHRKRESEANGKPSLASVISDRQRLEYFLRYCKGKGKASLSAIVTKEFLNEYRETQLDLVIERKKRGNPHGTGPVNARHRLRTVKALLLWARREEIIEKLPTKVEAGSFANIELPKPNPKTFTTKQIEKLFIEADEQQRLWILLGLNCGYTQSDISTLSHDMVNWKTGIIKRNRQKTGVTSEHKLWPITLSKLREQATQSTEDGIVLLNSKGNPLKHDNGETITDTISQSFRKLRKRLKLKLSFKYCRKTGAQALEKQFQDRPHLPTLYLAEEFQGKVRQHYTKQSFEALHEATDWLEQYFGFNDGGTLSGLGGSSSQ